MTTVHTNPDRRTTQRIQASIKAVLCYNSLMLPECQICDLSPEGAFVATSGHHLPDQALVDLTLNVSVAGAAPQRFSAHVMRCTEDGVGLRLQFTDAGSLRRLIEALYAA